MLQEPYFVELEAVGDETVEGRPPERRRGSRLRTVYRIARVLANGDQGLARVRNLSDEGIMLSLSLPICLGDTIAIDLSETCSLVGTVAWHEGQRCGVRLALPIDSAGALKRLFEERREGRSRPLRLQLDKSVLVSSELGLQMLRIRDVSQTGMKVVHDGRFTEGLSVKI